MKTVIKCFILLLLCIAALAIEDKTLGMSEANPASSCNQIYQHNPTSRGTINQYWIKTDEGLFKVTCNMKLKCGGVEGGWMQVVDVDMNRDDSCPGTWQKTTNPKKLCLGLSSGGCASANFHAKGVSYDNICGQAKAYQKGTPDAFFNSPKQSIDGIYVDGISITLGSPRKHVWTYAAGLSDDGDYKDYNCPCATIPGPSPPAFIGNDYYCESGDVGTYDATPYYLSDPLWDGSGCGSGNGCCAHIGMPWFHRTLQVTTTGDFEVRICKDSASIDNEDIAVEKLELFVL